VVFFEDFELLPDLDFVDFLVDFFPDLLLELFFGVVCDVEEVALCATAGAA
jgi:hypothetical protein